ncbi:hypothetical protein CWS72_18595 [Telmatospirillum siberiense]|uniref:PRC-barrel domain-containing protein n=1 Tax=Telmatospirillum siberiense TaxID=382514 RepID=A0A2N3PRQ8_9PROT|nr:hypothetical protein CWS72_18595 [Telmatospirillum siberiense]
MDGYAIEASDGRIGTVKDFLFDDMNWLVRWLVVDTGNWLSGRTVLLPASVLGHINQKKQEFSVRLTRQQIKDSPDIDTDKPVSRQAEINIYDYYGWSPYWGADFYLGGYGDLVGPPFPGLDGSDDDISDAQQSHNDPHLRSIEAVTGNHIQAADGEIGHVEDFLVQEDDWSIHYLVVDTKNWWPGKKVLISPRSVKNIDWTSKLVTLNVDRQRVKDSPSYDSSTNVNRIYENNFHHYYNASQPSDQSNTNLR